MSEPICALAADTKVETPEGPMTVKGVAGKPISVFTREPSGRVRFRRLLDVHQTAEQQPVLKIALENGHSFRVGPSQVLYKKGMVECRADALVVGDELQSAFHYPEGYRYRDDVANGEPTSNAAWRVASVGPAGAADVYSISVNQTGCFFLSAGVLCKAEAVV
jgi:hypothetical protein